MDCDVSPTLWEDNYRFLLFWVDLSFNLIAIKVWRAEWNFTSMLCSRHVKLSDFTGLNELLSLFHQASIFPLSAPAGGAGFVDLTRLCRGYYFNISSSVIRQTSAWTIKEVLSGDLTDYSQSRIEALRTPAGNAVVPPDFCPHVDGITTSSLRPQLKLL